MKTAGKLSLVTRRFYRPQQSHCPACQKHLRRAVTLSERTAITLQGALKIVHAGYRCPNPECAAHTRTYRSPQADTLALPGFTFGLDIVLLIGQLRLGQHQTVDETHRSMQERLLPLGLSISRREVLYLFNAYCTLLRAGTEAKEDCQWLDQVQTNGGMIVSMDGIQPDRGNETVYVVRDALTGRVLAAENVTASETAVLKQILAPVKALPVPILGTISDAQESLLQALEQTWPEVPHQVCQFHALQDASRPAYEVDRQVKTAMRKFLQPKRKDVRQQIERRSKTASALEAEQLAVLSDYADGVSRPHCILMGPCHLTTRQLQRRKRWMPWRAVWNTSKKRGTFEPGLSAETDPSAGTGGRTKDLAGADRTGQTHAPMGGGCRAYP